MGSNHSAEQKESISNDYVPYDSTDLEFFGALKIVETERQHIFKRRHIDGDNNKQKQKEYIKENLSGLALSGGGIRSASFSLGILQALSYSRSLKKIDYLSTVSGGGYIGSSLTWLLSRSWTDKDGDNVDLGVDKENFPYGTYPMLGQAAETGINAPPENEAFTPKRYRGALLRYLRQHGKYLTPGHGINGFSLLGVMIRGSLLSIFVYFSLLVLLMTGLEAVGAFASVDYGLAGQSWNFIGNIPNKSILYGLLGVVIFAGSALLYSFVAYFLSRRRKSRKTTNEKQAHLENLSYKLRRFCETCYNYLILATLILLVLGAIPEVYQLLLPNDSDSTLWASLTGVVSTAIGYLSSISAFVKTSSNKKGFLPVGLLVAVGTIALWFGLLLLAYHCAEMIGGNTSTIVTLAVVMLVVGWFANLNYISIHRYYRDRLMETFMPDVQEVLTPGDTPQHASIAADKARLSEMCGYHENKEKADMPYHIINCNLVLVASEIAKFKGRGGDNFILSPAWCGSNATGWQDSRSFMGGRMTLPTAMAISGAAVNPNTGVGGDGITRQPFLSMLMGFLNIRLGYWAANPNPEYRSNLTAIPNFFLPGFFEMFSRNALRENSRFLQISDGGHFENLGIYELIRRKANLIIACDGAADPDYNFTDLSNALEKVRTDFGVLINIGMEQLDSMIPKKETDASPVAFAQQGFIVADILYPDRDPGTLVYIKSSFFEALSADLYGYKKAHQEFPDEPTGDQFFDEKQFEAYRELGYQTAWSLISSDEVKTNKNLSRFFEETFS